MGVHRILTDISSGANLSAFVPTLMGTGPSIIVFSANKACATVGSVLNTSCTGGLISISSCANRPRVRNNLMGALSFGVCLNVLSRGCGSTRRTSLIHADTRTVSVIIIGLCPFGRAITGRNMAPRVTHAGVSVNNPYVMHTSTGGCLHMTSIASPTSCTEVTSRLTTGSTALSLRAHFTLVRGTFTRATSCSATVTNFFTRRTPRGVETACSVGT